MEDMVTGQKSLAALKTKEEKFLTDPFVKKALDVQPNTSHQRLIQYREIFYILMLENLLFNNYL